MVDPELGILEQARGATLVGLIAVTQQSFGISHFLKVVEGFQTDKVCVPPQNICN